MVGCLAAVVVLSFDVRARVDGTMTHCGSGATGVLVPEFEDPPRAFFVECDAAVARWRTGAVVMGISAAAIALGLGLGSHRRRGA